MASYLGKISAIVSANTAGYVRGLNEAATQTRAFAQTVQNDINRASKQADRSLKSILTPLQQFQRSLNAAVSERLAFKGVDGIVTGIGQLQTKLRELQRQGSRTVSVALNVSGRATVDQLIEDLDVLDSKKVQAVIEAVNTESINRAKAQLEQLYSVANEIAQPLAAAARQFEQLGLSVQASFIPALNTAQTAVQELETRIREGGRVSQDEFDRVAKVVDRTTSAIRRLAQVSSSVGGLASGTELEFTDPLLRQRLAAANQASRRAIGSSAETIAGNPQIASLTTQLRNAAEFAQTLQANLERARLGGLQQDIEAAERRLSAASETVSRITSALNAATAAPAIEAANRRLNVLTDSDLAEDQRQIAERAARDEIGAGVDPAIRKVQQLGSQVQSVRSQIDALPATIGSEFVPRLREAEQAFVRLRTSGRATAEEIENASNEVQQLAAQVRRVSQAQNIGSFADVLDDTALRGAIGNLQALQQILNRVGATAGSEGARQFDRLRDAIQRAANAGTIGTQAVQDGLEEIVRDAAEALAATGKIGKSAAFREIQRGGDIARGGFDKLSLATQQAAFAIDDFFSATGDLSQRIRAVQNNVTQLAFIIDGTRGLFIGLGVAIAAQATIALIKWANGTVDAEDKTQALNDALARQKSLVEELKQAFDSLGDSLTRGIFDEVTERAREFNRQIEDIRRKSAEVRQEQAASLDAGVNEQRAIQVDLRNQLDRESDAGARVGLERRIAASQEEERRLARRAANRRVDVGDVVDQVVKSLEDQLRARAEDTRFATGFAASLGARSGAGGPTDAANRAAERAIEPLRLQTQQRIDEVRRVGGGADVFELERILNDRIDELTERAAELPTPGFGNLTAALGAEREAVNQQIGELESVLRSLKAPIERALLDLRLNILDSAQEVAGSLRASKDIIENSLGDFGPLAAVQRELSSRFNAVVKELRTGRLRGEDDGRELNQEEIQQRKAVLERLQQETQQLESTTRSAEALEQAFRRLADQLAETVRQEAAADVERTRRAANAAEARDGNGFDDFRRAAEREIAQAPQPEPLIDLEPLQRSVGAREFDLNESIDAGLAKIDRQRAPLAQQQRDLRAQIQGAADSLLDESARSVLNERLPIGGSSLGTDALLATRGELQTQSVDDVRKALLDAGASKDAVDAAIESRKLWNQGIEDESRVIGEAFEQSRDADSARKLLEKAFDSDDKIQDFVASYFELYEAATRATEEESENLLRARQRLAKQFADRLSDSELAELFDFGGSISEETQGRIDERGRLQEAIDRWFDSPQDFRESFNRGEIELSGIAEAARRILIDGLPDGQLTPEDINQITQDAAFRTTESTATARREESLSEREARLRGARFNAPLETLRRLSGGSDSEIAAAAKELIEARSSLSAAQQQNQTRNEQSQELAAEIESIRNAIDAFDGSLEARRAIAEAADASRFDEIADAADIFLQKVRDLDLERAVSAFEEQIALEGQQRIEQLDQQRQEFQRNAQERFQREALRGNAPEGIADAIRQRDELLSVNNRTAEQESQLAQASDAIRNAFEQTAEGQQAARLADEIDIERQRQVQAREQRDAVRESAARGQDLLLRPEDVAARRGLTQFEDAQNAVLENLIGPLKEVGGDGVAAEIEDGILSLQELSQIFKRSPEIRQQLEGEIQESLANLQQARDNITGNISTQIAQFDAERSRPSRQALQAQDINTQQGRAELNRLLRGDDANRDQPILQGIKEQTAILKLIDQRIDEVNRVVGVAGA